MFSKLDTILLGNQFVGLELFTANAEEGIALVVIERKKGELIISHKEKRNCYKDLVEKPNTDLPIFLVINNSQIIQKEVEGIDINDSKIINKAFPNLKTDDFHYEIWRVETKSIIAICRKSYIEELLISYKEFGITFSSISLGVCSISQIKTYTEVESLKTNTLTLFLNSNETTVIKSNENAKVETFEINGLEIQSSYLIGFSAVLRWVIKNNNNTGSIVLNNTNLLDCFYQKSFLKKGIKVAVFGLLIILLINFFVFTHYFNAVNNTSTDLTTNKVLIENIKDVKARLKIKEIKLENTITRSNSKSSWIINEIIKKIPQSILINELTYHPLEKNIKLDEAIVTLDDIILISGKTINNSAFTDWIESIESNKWINNVTITHFGKNETKETIFTIKISIQPNETQQKK